MKHSSKPNEMGAKKRKATPKSPAEVPASEAPVLHASAGSLPAADPSLVLNPSTADRIGNPSTAGVSAESLGVSCRQSSPWFDFWCKIFDVVQDLNLDFGDDADAD